MCLLVSHKRHKDYDWRGKVIPFVADRPLIVIKRARKVKYCWVDGETTKVKYESPYQHTPIAMEVEYTTTLDARKGNFAATSVERGFHCYLFNAKPIAWDSRPTLSRLDMETILGVIPVGALYYIGTESEVVTNKIMYFENMDKLKAYYGIKEIAEPYSAK
jgi:hypothetical protein